MVIVMRSNFELDDETIERQLDHLMSLIICAFISILFLVDCFFLKLG